MAEAGKILNAEVDNGSLATVFTAGTTWTGKAHIVLLHVANKTATSAWVSVAVRADGSNDRYLIFQQPVPGNEFISFTTHLILESGDILKAQAQTATALDITLSGYEDVT